MSHQAVNRRRSALLTFAGLGAAVCVLGGAVLVAALQDTARTGTSSVESAALAASADIQVADATGHGSTIECGTFSEDQTSELFALFGVSAGFSSSAVYLCIRNIGSQPVTLSALADDLVDIDFACTGEESHFDPTSCGADGVGELSGRLFIDLARRDCETKAVAGGASQRLDGLATSPTPLGSVASNETACISVRVLYASDDPPSEVQKAQSDRATWRFRFTGQA